MATDPNATRAAQAGKTVTTSDGYQIVYDDNGFGRKSIGPDGQVKYYDSLGNQTTTPYDGPDPKVQSTAEQSTAAQAETPLSPVKQSEPTSEKIPEVQADGGKVAAQESTSDEKLPQAAGLDPKEEIVPKTEQEVDDELRNAMPATEDTPGPTEQDVIDASKEPLTMTDEQKAAQEKEQADNRAKLRAEENPQSPIGKVVPLPPMKDWRVRMSIAPTLQALYNVAAKDDILTPLKATGGVIFPYTPTIQTGYKANYEVSELVHTNYKNYFYKNSSVEDLTITADFTAQDQEEARYLLAVMHFFRSVTKMFYGQDKSPSAGTPPPLVFLNGFGAYQYDNHPVLISAFSYTLPNDVDYIRTTSNGGYSSTSPGAAGAGGLAGLAKTASKFGLSGLSNMFSGINRLASAGLSKGGGATASVGTIKGIANRFDTTYVPTKIQLTISAYPIVTRRDISQTFSLEQYAKGTIYRGSQRGGSGIW